MEVKNKTALVTISLKDINEAITMFLKKNGYEPLEKFTRQDASILNRNEGVSLNCKVLTIEEINEEAQESPTKEINIIFPDDFIAKLGRYSQGLGMFLYNVSSSQVQKILNETYGEQSGIERRVLASYHQLYDDTNKKFVDATFNGSDPDLHYRSAIHIFTEELHVNFRKALFEKKLEPKLDISRDLFLEKNIIDLRVSNRSSDSLLNAEITTVEKLLSWYESDYPKDIKNLGPKSFKEIQDFIKLHKLAKIKISVVVNS